MTRLQIYLKEMLSSRALCIKPKNITESPDYFSLETYIVEGWSNKIVNVKWLSEL